MKNMVAVIQTRDQLAEIDQVARLKGVSYYGGDGLSDECPSLNEIGGHPLPAALYLTPSPNVKGTGQGTFTHSSMGWLLNEPHEALRDRTLVSPVQMIIELKALPDIRPRLPCPVTSINGHAVAWNRTCKTLKVGCTFVPADTILQLADFIRKDLAN